MSKPGQTLFKFHPEAMEEFLREVESDFMKYALAVSDEVAAVAVLVGRPRKEFMRLADGTLISRPL